MTQSTYFWNRNSNCEICTSWLLLCVSCWMNMSSKLFISSCKYHFAKSCQKFVATCQLEFFHIVYNLVCVANLYKKRFSYLHGPSLVKIGDHPWTPQIRSCFSSMISRIDWQKINSPRLPFGTPTDLTYFSSFC